METLADLIARERRSDAPACREDSDPPHEFDYRRFCTTVWKVGNVLRHHGVRNGADVAIAPAGETTAGTGRRAKAVLSMLGATLVGARVRVIGGTGGSAPETTGDADDRPAVRALIAPTDAIDAMAVDAAVEIGYGDEPSRPGVVYWEGTVWSENPAHVPVTFDGGTAALVSRTTGRTWTHADLLAAGAAVVDELDLTAADAVAIRAPLSHPGTIAGGVVAPLVTGGSIRFPNGETGGDAAVVAGKTTPEGRCIAADAVL
ncbi:hypothetical protein BRD17_01300 [Halobacteriales archaeon SW_7_68_16]|nr:MAG: hypothetical protein BRD17_01300 [Halobacteriales archaeon SW_7_68_16]